MAISVRNLYECTKDKYKINLICGYDGIDNDVRWIYFMEDIEVADFLYGREFVITTGFAMNDENWLIALESQDNERMLKCLKDIADRIRNLYKIKSFIGIGSSINGLKNLSSNYKRATAALIMAKSKDVNIAEFDKMGIYRAILTSENKDVLKEIYYEQLGKLIDYDKRHKSNLKETLKHYIANNKSIQAVSEETYVHRNTVNYRVKKIKNILKYDLENYEDIFAYQMAFFIEEIMK